MPLCSQLSAGGQEPRTSSNPTMYSNDTRWHSKADPKDDSSAFGASAFSSTNNSEPFGTSGSAGRYAGLDFYEDPFKNSDYRYGDPFEISSSDPFSSKPDPFTSPDSEVFGSDPFSGSSSADPFGTSSDSKATTPAGGANDPFSPVGGGGGGGGVPFGGSAAFGAPAARGDDSADPFGGGSFTGGPTGSIFSNSAPNVDPFGANSNFSGSNDPFSLTNLNALKPPPSSDINSNQTKPSLGSSLAGVTYRKKSDTAGDSADGRAKSKRSSHSLSDLWAASPNKDKDKAQKDKEKKDKRYGKFNLPSPLKTKSKNSPKSDKKSPKGPEGGETSNDELQMRLASEFSRRSEDDRLRRLRLQEEQDLAYAIALSKAEAASLKQ